MKEPLRKMSVIVKERQYQLLLKEAKVRDMKLSALIRQMIERYFNEK